MSTPTLATEYTVRPAVMALTDIDLYKLTMGQFVWYHHPEAEVTYTFNNRHADRVPIAELISEWELGIQLEQAQGLRLSVAEYEYLRTTGLFAEDYLAFLRWMRLPKPHFERVGDQYRISVTGPWKTAIYWETMILSIVNQLINQRYQDRSFAFGSDQYDRGKDRLRLKFDLLRRQGVSGVVDFGTRRRFNARWHDTVVEVGAEQYPDVVIGTSNVHLARKHGLPAKGTFAHEMPMAYAALAEQDGEEAVRASHGVFLDQWFAMYGRSLSIALTDTFGAKFFFEDLGVDQSRQWRGLRHDSGDPYRWTEQVLALYRQAGIDPKDKLLLYSDGLDKRMITELYRRYGQEATLGFGWGTNLTNDLGHPATSMVMKLTHINGVETVKLSDNLAKATGSPEKIRRYTRIFGHPGANYIETTY